MIKLQIIIFGCFLFHIISSFRLHSTPAASFTLTTAKLTKANRAGKTICSHQLLMISTDVFSQSSKSSSSASSEHFPNNNTSNDNNHQNSNGHNSDFSSDPNQQRFPPSSILNDSTEIMKKNNWKIIPDIWDTLAKKIPNQIMLIDEIHSAGSSAPDGVKTSTSVSLTFAQANRRIVQGATTLQQKLGILPGDCIAMFAENSYRWFLLDQSIMKTGACNAVRGISAPTDELHYIYKNSRSVGMVLENCQMLSNLFQNYSLRGKMLKSPADDYPLPKFVIVLYSQGMSGKEMYEKYIIHNNTNTNGDISRSGDSSSNNSYGHTLKFIKENDIKLLSYEEFEEMGSDETIINNRISNTTTNPGTINEFRPIVRDGGSTATVVYTSGTTSRPKGVLLRHRNLMYQILENALVSDDSLYVVPVTVPTLIPPNLIPPSLASWGVKYVFFKELFVNLMNALWKQWRSIRKTLSNPITPTTTFSGAPTATTSSPCRTATATPTTSLSTAITTSTITPTVNPQIGDVFVSVLPCWHIFERTCEYLALARGSTLVYSDLKHFKKDIIHKRPHLLIVVPRLLQSIQKGIISNLTQQKGFNKQLIEVATKITDLYNHCHKIYSNRYLSDHKPLLIQRILFGVFTLLIYPFFLLSDKLVWSKIRLGLGGRIKAIVSGGASLPLETDLFFERIGISLLNGYGMTETSPVIANRKVDYNVIGSVGTPVHQTSIKIIDLDSRECVPVSSGKSGLLYVKGPGLMAGYTINNKINNNNISNNGSESRVSTHSNHQPLHIGNHHNNNHQHTKISSVTTSTSSSSTSTASSSATAVTGETLDREGYFNTGDLAKIDVATGCLVITGRYKDTIVLSNGENVTPEPIEERIVASTPLIDQVMLVGQDKKNLAALIVINTKEWAIHCGGSSDSSDDGDSSSGSDIILTSDLKEPISTTDSSSTSSTTNRNQGTVLMTQQAARHQALKIDTKSLNDDPQLRLVIRNAIDQAQGFISSSGSSTSSSSGSGSSGGSVITGANSGTSAKQRAWERVSAFTLLSDPFTVENGLLTQTLKIKRSAVAERYHKEIQNMYNTNIAAQQQ